MFQKILVAIDHSDSSRRVFETALTLAKSLSAQLMLVHVLTPVEKGYPERATWADISNFDTQLQQELMERYSQQWQTFEQQTLQRLQWLVNEAEDAGVTTDWTQRFGTPGSVLCQVAKTWGADLIVLGRRGHRGLTEMLLGSVSNYVLHHAPCSVIVVQHLPVADASTLDQAATVS
ncbi:MAG: universal stress protein [Synechococcales cyanobacterium C42_A2020_086]|jgi:nucleotide-binding universal stress UspA family protein|nr:universal stress protein [Synechococcales cyanobacterium C42_A2020_086]